jgi:hypothetical protein
MARRRGISRRVRNILWAAAKGGYRPQTDQEKRLVEQMVLKQWLREFDGKPDWFKIDLDGLAYLHRPIEGRR